MLKKGSVRQPLFCGFARKNEPPRFPTERKPPTGKMSHMGQFTRVPAQSPAHLAQGRNKAVTTSPALVDLLSALRCQIQPRSGDLTVDSGSESRIPSRNMTWSPVFHATPSRNRCALKAVSARAEYECVGLPTWTRLRQEKIQRIRSRQLSYQAKRPRWPMEHRCVDAIL